MEQIIWIVIALCLTMVTLKVVSLIRSILFKIFGLIGLGLALVRLYIFF